MKERTLFREFLWYASLNILGMLGLSCYILADTFFVAQGLGADGLAALNLAIPVYSFVHGTGLMLGMGGATRYAIFRGQGSEKNGDRVFSQTLQLGAAFAVLFMTSGLLFSRQLAALLGADETGFSMTNTYLKVILLFAPAFIGNDILICFVRNDGNPRLSMTGMLLGSFSNIILDYVFIFPFGMGIFGAVLATGFAPVISMLILSSHIRSGKNRFHFRRQRPRREAAASVIALGFPSLITEVSSGLVIIVFNILILGLAGNTGVAAYGVIANLSLVVISLYTGIAQGVQPLMSRAWGRQERGEALKAFCYAVGLALLISAAVYAILMLFTAPLVSVFNSEGDARLQEMAEYGMRIYFKAIPFAGFNIVLSVLFTSTEQALPAQLVSLLRGLILIVPAAVFLSGAAGLTGVWLAFPVTEGTVAALGAVLLARTVRQFCGKQF